ncbi:MAG: TIGR03067 domain-containing protein [Planctomycetota bacterium]
MQFDYLKPFHSLVVVLSITLLATGVSRAQDDKPKEKQESVDVESLMDDAQEALDKGEFGKAVKIYKQVIVADKTNGRAWHRYGYALHADGQLDKAIEIHKKAAKFDDYKAISLYNLGCAYSLQKKTKPALKALHQALDANFRQLDMFDSDSDLENVRKDKGFKAIATRVKNGGARPKFDTKQLVGSWQVTKGVRAGEEVDGSRLPVITIDKKSITIPAGAENFVMNYKLDDKNRPVKVDMAIAAGPAPEGSKALGIIKRQRKKLTLCYDPMGMTRPTKFESTSDNNFFLFEMELEASEKEDGDKKDGDKKEGDKEEAKDSDDEDG